MKKIITFLVFLFLLTSLLGYTDLSIAQTLSAGDNYHFIYDSIGEFQEGILPVSKQGKWGAIDSDGNILIPFMWDELNHINQGMISVKQKNRYGLIDTYGNIQIAPEWEEPLIPHLAIQPVKQNGLWGLMNHKGELLSNIEWDHMLSYHMDEGYLPVKKDGLWGLMNTEGTLVISPKWEEMDAYPLQDGYVLAQKEGKWGAVDLQENILVPFDYDQKDEVPKPSLAETSFNPIRYDFSDGLAPFRDSKWGYLNNKGETVIPSQWDEARGFSNGVAQVKEEEKWGLINTTGDVITPFIYDGLLPFSEQLAAACKNGQWGFIDTMGIEVISFQYHEVRSFSEGLAAVKLGDYWGYITPGGEIAIKPVWTNAESFANGRAFVSTAQGQGLIDQQGDIIISATWDRFGYYGLIDETNYDVYIDYGNEPYNQITDFHEGLISTFSHSDSNSTCAIFDEAGRMVVPPAKWNWIGAFYDGRALAQTQYHYGAVDRYGNTLLEPVFHHIRLLSSDLAALQMEEDGKWAIAMLVPKDKKDPAIEDVGVLGEGLLPTKQKGKWGYINLQSEVIIPFIYDEALPFYKSVAPVRNEQGWGLTSLSDRFFIPVYCEDMLPFTEGYAPVKQKNKWNFIDLKGTLLSPAGWDQVEPFNQGLAPVMDGYRWGLINQLGETILPCTALEIKILDESAVAVKQPDEETWRFINLHNGIISENLYPEIGEPGEGLIPVQTRDLWGYADYTGQLILDCMWEDASRFTNGIARVRQNGTDVFINTKGETVLTGEWDRALSFNQYGYAPVYQNKQWDFVSTSGYRTGNYGTFAEEVKPYTSHFAPVKQNGVWNLIDTKGEYRLVCRADDIRIIDDNHVALLYDKEWIIITVPQIHLGNG